MNEEKIIDGLNTDLEKLTHRIQELIVENHKTQEGLKEKIDALILAKNALEEELTFVYYALKMERVKYNPTLLKKRNSSKIANQYLKIKRRLQVNKPDLRLVRTLVTFVEFRLQEDKRLALIYIPGWNPGKGVLINSNIIPGVIRSELEPWDRMFAFVNIGVEQSKDLIITRFELAPPLTLDDELA